MGRCGVNLDIIAQRIRDAGIDWEQAHSLEDEMMRQVLDAIATDKTAWHDPEGTGEQGAARPRRVRG